MIPSILVQIIFIPALVALLIFLFRYQLGKNAGWLAVIGLAYTTGLLLVALTSVSQGDPIKVDYQILINPDIRFSLLADGLSIAVALICNILCLVLCIYSIKYVDHRIELIYEGATYKEEVSYYACFFYLFLFFPLGFMGVSFAADLWLSCISFLKYSLLFCIFSWPILDTMSGSGWPPCV